MSAPTSGRRAAGDIHERLLQLVAEALGRPEVDAALPVEVRLSELGMSSIKMVVLMLALEREFDLAIPQDEITPENLRSVSSVEAMLARLLEAPDG